MEQPIRQPMIPAAQQSVLNAPVTVDFITGDYVEARTASVFAGACHYNGELVTSGRDAVLAWNIRHGSWNGVDLTGIHAMAAVSCDENLRDPSAKRRCDLIVDKSATDAQLKAITEWLRATDGSQLGEILTTHKAGIQFQHQGTDYRIASDGFALLMVQPMPNNECCTQPHLVWYTPLMPIEHRKVGYTQNANYTAGTVGDAWDRTEENSAFYGTFKTEGK